MLTKTTFAALALLALLQCQVLYTLADDQGSVTQDIKAAADHHQLLHYLQDQVSELFHTSTQYVQQLKPPKLDDPEEKRLAYDPSQSSQDASDHSTATALHTQLQQLKTQVQQAKEENVEALRQQYDKLKQKIQGGYDALLLRRKPATAASTTATDDSKITLEKNKPYKESDLAKLRAIGERKLAEAKAKAAEAVNTISISDDNDLQGISSKISQLVAQYTPTTAHDLKLTISQQATKLSQLLDSTKPSINIDTFPMYDTASKSLQQLRETLKDKDNIVTEAVKAKFEDLEVTLESIKRRAAAEASKVKSKAEALTGKAKQTLGVDEAAERTQAQGATLQDRLNSAADTVKSKASDVYDSVAGSTSSIPTKGDVSETLTRHATDAKQKAADAVGADSVPSVNSLLQSVKDRVGHVAESVTNALSGSGSKSSASSKGKGAGSADEIVDRNAPSVLESALHAVGLNEPDEL